MEIPYEPTLLDSPSTVVISGSSERSLAISMNVGDAPSVPYKNGETIALPEKCIPGVIPTEFDASPLLATPSDAISVPVWKVVRRPPSAGQSFCL